jgi:predicted nuclease with TOPRIM domain
MEKLRELIPAMIAMLIIYFLNVGYDNLFPEPEYKNLDDAIEKIHQLENEKKDINTRLEELETEFESLQSEKEDLEDENSVIRDDLYTVKQKIYSLDISVDTLVDEVEDFAHEDWEYNVPDVVKATNDVSYEIDEIKELLGIGPLDFYLLR